jgi:hypothetical protein
MSPGRTSTRLLVCAALLAGPAALPAGAQAARIDVEHVSSVLRAGRPAHMSVRLSFTGERICRLTLQRGRVTQTSQETLTGRRFVTWRWRVPRNALSGRWKLQAACAAEAELTVRATRRVPLAGVPGGRRVAASRLRVFTSGDPLVLAFVRVP